MKKFSKLLALILSLVMVCSCLIGCTEEEIKKVVNSATDSVKDAKDDEDTKNKNSDKDTKNNNNDEDIKNDEDDKKKSKVKITQDDDVSPTQIVANCFSSFESGDIESSKEYFSDEDIFNDLILSQVNIEDITSTMGDPTEFGLTQEEFDEKVEDFIYGMIDEIEFDVGDSDVDGDYATVEVIMSYPDFDSVNMDEILTDELMEVAIENAGYTMDELEEMGEEEGMEIMPEITSAMMDVMFDAMLDALKDAPKLEQEGELELEKIDGEWIIVDSAN